MFWLHTAVSKYTSPVCATSTPLYRQKSVPAPQTQRPDQNLLHGNGSVKEPKKVGCERGPRKLRWKPVRFASELSVSISRNGCEAKNAVIMRLASAWPRCQLCFEVPLQRDRVVVFCVMRAVKQCHGAVSGGQDNRPPSVRLFFKLSEILVLKFSPFRRVV